MNPSINNIINQANLYKNNSSTDKLQKKLDNAYKEKNQEELMDACKQFESLFMHMLLKEMRSTIPDGGITEKSTAREMFEDMYDQEMAKQASTQGQGIGLAKMLYEQMKNRI